MNEEYKEKLQKQFEQLKITFGEVEKIINLLTHSNTMDYDSKARSTAFLEGYATGLKEQIEWLNRIIP